MDSGDIINHLQESPRWILLGFQEQTVSVLITHETVMVYSADDIGPSNGRPEAPLSTVTAIAISEQTGPEPGIRPCNIAKSNSPSLGTSGSIGSAHHHKSSSIPISSPAHRSRKENSTSVSSIVAPGVLQQSTSQALIAPAMPERVNRPPPPLLRLSKPTIQRSSHLVIWRQGGNDTL